MKTLTVQVINKRVEAREIVSFELALPDGSPLPAFTPGAHIDVHIDEGLVRQYSLCNDSGERHRYRIAVLRTPDSRGGSIGMHDRITEGALVRIGEPRNHFEMRSTGHVLLLAGGIGVTPLLAMAGALARTTQPFDMHYCARTQAGMAFRDEIASSPFAHRVRFHADDGRPEQRFDLQGTLASCPPGTELYVCGPAGFMAFVMDGARAAGWPESAIHKEFFGAAPADGAEQGFDVELARSGKRVHVAADRSITAALAEQGIEIPVSCQQGVCGTCITRVIAGIPEHRDMYFSDAEHAANDQLTPCCSRARTPLLVLDL